MKRRRIGSLEVSIIGLGGNNFGWRLDAAGTADVVESALDEGINFFDTADMYGGTKSEDFLGRALGRRRDEAVIATKFGWEIDATRRGAHPDYVRRAVDDSLKRLGTDHIDLYQLHKPDPTVPIGDTLGALAEIVRAGKVREIGCSNFSAEQIREADAAARDSVRFVSVQNEYSVLHRDPEADVLAECERLGLAFIPFFPLASGLLTGKYRQGQPIPKGTRLSDRRPTEDRLAVVEALIEFAETRGHTLLELAFGYLLSQPVVASVIAGATSHAQVQANAQETEWVLTPEERAEVARLLAAAAPA
jgi:aryl-alcohol dehydrogenase-like predicted oxidoreductase